MFKIKNISWTHLTSLSGGEIKSRGEVSLGARSCRSFEGNVNKASVFQIPDLRKDLSWGVSGWRIQLDSAAVSPKSSYNWDASQGSVSHPNVTFLRGPCGLALWVGLAGENRPFSHGEFSWIWGKQLGIVRESAFWHSLAFSTSKPNSESAKLREWGFCSIWASRDDLIWMPCSPNSGIWEGRPEQWEFNLCGDFWMPELLCWGQLVNGLALVFPCPQCLSFSNPPEPPLACHLFRQIIDISPSPFFS